MKIDFNYLEMSYFKGIRHLRIDFEKKNTYICGDNGLGKSTVADAIQWVLFGKNAKGDTKFSIKTLDSSGEVIPNVEHSVELGFCANDQKNVIKKVWVETRKVSRGEETGEIEHHAEYILNGERVSKKVYEQFISDTVLEQTFRAVTSIAYFFNLKWQEQRAILEGFVDDVDYSCVVKDNPALKCVVENISKHGNLDAYIKHLGYNIRLAQDELKGIAPRIDELGNMMPEAHDWETLQAEVDSLNFRIADTQTLLSNTSSNSSIALVQLQKGLDFARRRKEQMEISATNRATEKRKSITESLNAAAADVQNLEKDYAGVKTKIMSLGVYIQRAKENLCDQTMTMDDLRNKWAANEKKFFAVDESELSCPMCGRPFDTDKRNGVLADMRERFNLAKAEEREKLRQKVMEVKEDILMSESLIKEYGAQVLELESKDYVTLIDAAKKKLKEAEAVRIPTADDLLDANPNYHPVCEEIESLLKKIESENATLSNEESDKYKNELSDLKTQLSLASEKLLSKNRIEEIEKRISELNMSEDKLRKQISELMRKEDMAREYGQMCDDILSRKINDNFEYVKFRLFSTLNDGTRKQDCIALIDGVPYTDANATAKINASIDVMNALCRKNDFVAPVVIDNCESYNTIKESLGQQILLKVTNDKQLKIY